MKHEYEFCTKCTTQWFSGYNQMDFSQIRSATNVNEETHPFLNTYENWICEVHDPNFGAEVETPDLISYNEWYPNQVRCCKPGDEEIDSLCRPS